MTDEHCLHGHPWVDNLVIRKSGGRLCRECNRIGCMKNSKKRRAALIASGNKCACGCGEVVGSKFIIGHQQRLRKTPPLERFMKKIRTDASTGCWIWIAGIKSEGYGGFEKERAHVVAYKLFKGQIHPGLVIDHLCRNHSCVNPQHLEAVTQQVNVLRGEGIAAKRARQTHCVNGHEFSSDNLYIYRGYRFCRICRKAKSLRWARKNAQRVNEQKRLGGK